MVKAIIMPKLDMTMEAGEISSWLVREGDAVKKGDALFEVLSEKAAIEVESTANGIVLKILRGEGETVGVTEIVAVVGKAGEDYSHVLSDGKAATASEDIKEEVIAKEKALIEELPGALTVDNGKVAATPAAKALAKNESIDLNHVAKNKEGKIRKQQVEAYIEDHKIKMTPLAAKIIDENDVDIEDISSDKSRIYSEDVIRTIHKTPETAVEGVKLKGIRKISAQRLTEVWQTVPMVTNTVEVDVLKVLELCERYNKAMRSDAIKVNLTDVIIKVMATALDRNPETNVALIGDLFVKNEHVNISMAVSTDKGLMVPVIKDVNRMGLKDINIAKRAVASRAREGRLLSEDMVGGSMTISNIGMFGVDIFTPLINMPESSILGIGRINKKPVVVDDAITIRPMMWLSHTFDHRALDGVPAMQLLGSIRDMIENPDLLIY